MNRVEQPAFTARLNQTYLSRLKGAARADLEGNAFRAGVLLAEADSILKLLQDTKGR